MFVILFLIPWFLSGNCFNITPALDFKKDVPEPSCICVAKVARQYFKETKNIVFLNSNSLTNTLLKTLHSMEMISFSNENSDENAIFTYMIILKTVEEFLASNIITKQAKYASWNPDARFLVVFLSLRTEDLRQIFDIFLHHRANNVVVLNGTLTAELYTYNPFENFACGRFFTRIISYGKCSEVIADIYPAKAIAGLKNCFFNVSVPHWPPWSLNPSKINAAANILGTEQYIFHLMSEVEQFKYKFNFDYNPEAFSSVSENLTISGPMIRLAQNRTDIMLGGQMLIASRAKVFSYISGHLDYLEEIRLMVKRAGKASAWKNCYLGFSATVWVLLIFTLLLYSALVATLLKAKDKGLVLLVLLDSLLSHGAIFRSQYSVKYVVLIWVSFAYLVNSYYTTSLMSLTTSPPKDYQIQDEQTIIDRQLEPCISLGMGQYLNSEQNHGAILKNAKYGTEGCVSLIDSINTVSKSDRRFTIVLYSIYSMHKLQFYDHYEKPSVFSFKKPYTRVVYAIYFNKGLPMKEKLQRLGIHIREAGLPERNLKYQFFNHTLYTATKLRLQFPAPRFEAHFAMPWYLYAVGLFLSTFTFIVELASQYNKVQAAPVDK